MVREDVPPQHPMAGSSFPRAEWPPDEGQARGWRAETERNAEEWNRICDKRAGQHFDGTITPRAVASELSPRLPDGAIVTADSGSGTNWWARHPTLREGMRASLSGTLATTGPGSALRDRRPIRLSGPPGDRLRRGRRVPDERQGDA